MGTYVARRLMQTVLVVFGSLTLLFFMFVAIPGDTLAAKSGDRVVNTTVRRNVEAHYGLDQPLPVQFARYWKSFLTGDLGRSYVNDRPVATMLGEAAKTSSRLAFWGLMIQLMVGLPVGVIAAVRRYSVFDALSGFVAVAITGVPVFVTGLLFQFVTGVLPGPNYWKWPQWARLPVQGFDRDGGSGRWLLHVIPVGDTWKYLIGPALVITAVQLGLMTRVMRTSMLEVLRADYMRTATAKGLSRRKVIFKHGMRNALIPVVTIVGADIVSMFGVAVLTETVFNLNGVGSRTATAVQAQDVPVVLGFVAPVVLLGALLYLLVDIAYAWLDPRIRLGQPAVV